MIMNEIKKDLKESAQDKLKAMIAEAVEKKLQKEMKKISRKLTINFIIFGIALAGSYIVVHHSDKIISLITRKK